MASGYSFVDDQISVREKIDRYFLSKAKNTVPKAVHVFNDDSFTSDESVVNSFCALVSLIMQFIRPSEGSKQILTSEI